MADFLRSRQKGTQNRRRSVKALRTARRPRHQSSSLSPGDLEVICDGRGDSVPGEGPGVHHQERANRDHESRRLPPSKGLVRTSPPILTSNFSLTGSTNPPDEGFVNGTPVRLTSAGITKPTKLIPKIIVIPDQVKRSSSGVVPPPSKPDSVKTFFKAESATHVTSAVQWNRAMENLTRSSTDHAEGRPQFRKLYSSDSHSIRAERVEELLNQGPKENASEKAQYRGLYSADQAKDTVTPLQEFTESHSTSTDHDRQEPKQQAFIGHATQQDNVPGTTRYFSKSPDTKLTKDGGGSSDEMAEPRGNVSLSHVLAYDLLLTSRQNTQPIPKATRSRKFDTTSGPVTSWMHLDTRKCLLCDGRKFPGDAFYKHERESQRHRDNLRNEDKVAKAEARLQKMSNRRLLHSLPERTEATHSPPLPGHHKLRQKMSKAEFPGQRGCGLSPALVEQNSVAVGGNPYNKDETSSRPTEEQVVEDILVSKTAPLKRKCLVVEPEDGGSSTQPNTKRARAIPRNSEARDDVLVQMSSADLEKLLQLHPDIFDKKWNQRSTPAPPGWQAIRPSTPPKTGDGMETAPYCRQSGRSEEVQIIESRACLRKSSEMTRDYFQTPSRCDNSADSDYREEEDEDEDEAEDDD